MMTGRPVLWILGLLLIETVGACGPVDASEGSSPHAPRPQAPGAPGTADGYTLVDDAMAAIGYVDFGTPDDEPDGVVVHDEARSSPGYSLFVSIPFGAAYLIDASGGVVRSWRTERDVQWTRAVLCPDGRLIVIGAGGEDRHLECRAWTGELLWRRQIPVHHDVRLLPDGGFLTLTRSIDARPELHATAQLQDDRVAHLDADGHLVAEASVYEAFRDSGLLDTLRPIGHMPPNRNGHLDGFHCNSIDRMDAYDLADRHPLFAAGHVLLSARHQNRIIVVDVPEQRVVWTWGEDELLAQHEATLQPSGRILIFDNGNNQRGYTRIVEVDPTSAAITWEYTAPSPEDFYCGGRGTAQALPNGNVLVGNSGQGEAFEVTRDGDIVWRFLNPQRNDGGARGSLRIHRYEPAYVEAILAR